MTKKDAPAPEPMDVEADIPVKIGSQSHSEAPRKPLMAKRGQFMDFAPNRRRAPLVSHEAVSEMPTNATPRKRLFIGDIKPVRRARRPQMETPRIDAPEMKVEAPDMATDEIVEKPVENSSDEPIEMPVEIPTEPPLETPVEKPRHRGLRMDFIKRVSAVIKPAREDDMDEGEDISEDVPEEPIREEIEAEPEAPEEVETPETQTVARRPVVMDVSSVSRVDIRREPAVEADDATDDDLPPQNEDELSAILAGFADSDAPDMTDNLSKEVVDFEEELDALEDLEEAAADFVSEPKPLFVASGADPLVEQSIHRKKPEISEPTTYIDGSAVREDDDVEIENNGKMIDDFVETPPPKPPVEPYRQILGGKSPFLNSVNVEKRPLSGYTSEPSIAEEQSTTEQSSEKPLEKRAFSKFVRKANKNDDANGKTEDNPQKNDKSRDDRHEDKHKYEREDERRDERPSHFSSRFSEPSISIPSNKPKGLSLPLILAIILTLILGAGAGAFIYLVFLQ
ncbi:hypothetical protein IKG12_00955 [Candidatus Saccharibacteria bacterium]|nr:hypothetical protein [Candidatus Saccharibacteria bacterium]